MKDNEIKEEDLKKYLDELKDYIRKNKVSLSRKGIGGMAYFKTKDAIEQLTREILESGKSDYPKPSDGVRNLVFGDKTILQIKEETRRLSNFSPYDVEGLD